MATSSGFFNLLSEYSSWVTALVSQSHFGVSHNVFDPAIACAGLERLLIPNVTILNAIYYDEPINASSSELFDTISIDVPAGVLYNYVRNIEREGGSLVAI